MKRLICTLLITSALGLAAVPAALAHGTQIRTYERHHIVRHGHHYPNWLRRNRDFDRWYRRSRHRHDFYLSWQSLFDIYRFESRYHRPYRYPDRYYRDRHRRAHRH